jgi:hypothetical protein
MTKKMPDYIPHPASYRDPAGFVFRANGLYYRQVNRSYSADYEELLRSGLYQKLTEKGLLVPHTEVDNDLTEHPDRYKILLPEQIPYISYPDEWSPSQLKDAAGLTLQILHIALDHGMILKDASPLNIQFRGGKALFIDTLSFEKYDPALPWVAYRQFCECFLFPLLLHHYLSTGTDRIASAWPEGIPATVTARLLPWKSRLRLGVWLHVLLPASVRKDSLPGGRTLSFNKTKLLHLTGNLGNILTRLKTATAGPSAWNNYYQHTIMSQTYLAVKEQLFREFTGDIGFRSALDLGSNDGYFTKILAEKGVPVIAIDSDWSCIDNLYRYTRQQPGKDILPLRVDIADPTPARGFNNTERSSFTSRTSADLVVALALLHHLTWGRNIPLPEIAAWLSMLTGAWLILEFVPRTDPKALELAGNRRSLLPDYDAAVLEAQFSPYFSIDKQFPIAGTERVLYRMRKNTFV